MDIESKFKYLLKTIHSTKIVYIIKHTYITLRHITRICTLFSTLRKFNETKQK